MTERQPAGQPTGGQFAPTSGADAGLDLREPKRYPAAPDLSEEPDGSVMMPPGRYFIGDPCYAISEEHWDAYWKSDFEEDELNRGYGYLIPLPGGGHALALRTRDGDGTYDTGDFKTPGFPVDSGLLGMVPMSHADRLDVRDGTTPQGQIVTLTTTTRAHADETHTMHLGPFSIHTGDTCEDCNQPIKRGLASVCNDCRAQREWDEEAQGSGEEDEDWT